MPLEVLLGILEAQKGPWKITDLMIHLRDHGHLDEALFQDLSPDQVAFRKTFWLNHQLYRLDQDLQEKGEGRIHRDSLWIRYLSKPGPKTLSSAGDTELAEYYLNPNHYWDTGEEEIEALLRGFWEEYSHWFDRGQILEALGLPEVTGERELRQALRKRIKETHPDQGGDQREFQKIWSSWQKYRQGRA
jgi:hypothetical protein